MICFVPLQTVNKTRPVWNFVSSIQAVFAHLHYFYCPLHGGAFPTLITLIILFFVGVGGGIGRSLTAAVLLMVLIVPGVFMTFRISRLLPGTL